MYSWARIYLGLLAVFISICAALVSALIPWAESLPLGARLLKALKGFIGFCGIWLLVFLFELFWSAPYSLLQETAKSARQSQAAVNLVRDEARCKKSTKDLEAHYLKLTDELASVRAKSRALAEEIMGPDATAIKGAAGSLFRTLEFRERIEQQLAQARADQKTAKDPRLRDQLASKIDRLELSKGRAEDSYSDATTDMNRAFLVISNKVSRLVPDEPR